MKFILQRFSDNRESTLGLLYKVGALTPFFSYTLEDEFRESKKTGETRVPAMTYNLVLQKTETPKTVQYRKKYPWFIFHIMLENVPGFVGVYIHIGNNDDNTDGCLLLGDSCDNNSIAPGTIAQSTNAFKRFYGQVFEALTKGEIVTLEIRDEKFLQIK
jgi:hypothetical protein